MFVLQEKKNTLNSVALQTRKAPMNTTVIFFGDFVHEFSNWCSGMWLAMA